MEEIYLTKISQFEECRKKHQAIKPEIFQIYQPIQFSGGTVLEINAATTIGKHEVRLKMKHNQYLTLIKVGLSFTAFASLMAARISS